MIPTSLAAIRQEHANLAAMLQSIRLMLVRMADQPSARDFETLRAMLFYIDEVPERQHHPKESDLLFPRVVAKAPEAMPIIQRLEQDHIRSELAVRELQHLLLAWELLGDSRRDLFMDTIKSYLDGYMQHIQAEEREVMPLAQRCLDAEDWAVLDAAFAQNRDPLGEGEQRDPIYDRLFQSILTHAPAPIGLGAS